MGEITRYRMTPAMVVRSDGEFVAHSDHIAAMREKDERIKQLQDDCTKLMFGRAENYEAALERAEAQRDELLENLRGCVEALSSHAPDCLEVECATKLIHQIEQEKA